MGYGVSAGVMAALIFGLTWFTFFATRNVRSVQHKPEEDESGFFRNLLMTLRFKPFVYVRIIALWEMQPCVAFLVTRDVPLFSPFFSLVLRFCVGATAQVMLMYLFSNLAIQFMQNNLFLFAQIVLQAERDFSYLLLVIEASTLLSLVLWARVSTRFGKHNVYMVGNTVFCGTVAALYFLPAGMIWLMYLLAAVAGLVRLFSFILFVALRGLSLFSALLLIVLFCVCCYAVQGVAAGLLLPMSMLPDVIDAFELEHGKRHEGVFYR
jgi:Na+/melibiose symporter-like transporter